MSRKGIGAKVEEQKNSNMAFTKEEKKKRKEPVPLKVFVRKCHGVIGSLVKVIVVKLANERPFFFEGEREREGEREKVIARSCGSNKDVRTNDVLLHIFVFEVLWQDIACQSFFVDDNNGFSLFWKKGWCPVITKSVEAVLTRTRSRRVYTKSQNGSEALTLLHRRKVLGNILRG